MTALTRLDALPGGPDAAAGLPGHWYVVCPAGRRAAGPFEVAGRPVEAGHGTVEQDGYVWTFVGPGAPAGPAAGAPPRLDVPARPGMVVEQRTICVQADWRIALENSLDFAHSPILHAWSSPLWLAHHLRRNQVVAATYRATSDGLTVDGRLGGRVLFRHSFHLPDRMRLTLLPDAGMPLDVLVHHVPAAPGKCRMEVLVGRRRLPWERAGGIRFRPGAMLLHRQDIAIVEAQQKAFSVLPAGPERHCAADAYTLLLRRVLERAARGELPEPGPEKEVPIRI